MKIVVYGLAVTSSWGNGHATTYRALLKALSTRGHRIHFIERDVEWYRNHRDLPDPDFCTVQHYESWEANELSLLAPALDADAVIVGSYFPDATAASRALFAAANCPVFFYDIDTPVTLSHLRQTGCTDYLEASLVQHYAAYLSFTGGPLLHELKQQYGARRAIGFYCSVDADLYRPCPGKAAFGCDLSYLGTYASDRQRKLMQFLNSPAVYLPHHRFLVAGPMYPHDTPWQPNVRRIDHVPPPEHPSFYSSSRFTLNLTRADMVSAGYSPSVRLFEAAACGAPILSDQWRGLDEFFTPEEEILLPANSAEVADILLQMTDGERLALGRRARERVLAEHTSMHRAVQFEAIVSEAATRSAPRTAVLPTIAHNAPASPAAAFRS